MQSNNDDIRALIARQAGEWYETNRIGLIAGTERKSFEDWLLSSPAHVEEYLAVASIAKVLPAAADDPAFPIERILDRLNDEPQSNVTPIQARRREPEHARLQPRATRWRYWAVAASCCVAIVGGALWWNFTASGHQQLVTGHGDQQTVRLVDGSVLHLNTDSAVTIRYSRDERLVDVDRGQAFFLVAHEAGRHFHVVAGAASVIAVGTQFDVYRQADVTDVTVVEGRVKVEGDRSGAESLSVGPGEQARIIAGVLPSAVAHVNAQRSTAWLRRQIVFDNERLADVAAEFNRYSTVPITIDTPSLREMRLTGAFSADDTESFIAFMRSLRDVTVEASATQIRIHAR